MVHGSQFFAQYARHSEDTINVLVHGSSICSLLRERKISVHGSRCALHSEDAMSWCLALNTSQYARYSEDVKSWYTALNMLVTQRTSSLGARQLSICSPLRGHNVLVRGSSPLRGRTVLVPGSQYARYSEDVKSWYTAALHSEDVLSWCLALNMLVTQRT
ncbi:hypothetical protein E4U13_003412 [Claviceps humidiphila]|uniref:Uncharacterized protein n=1 Tax=Claviceps humidiphila TaxID=1294629 RepID=A0A9P7TPU7_9HYPO|nr:hypothetical protein E4U13_003412 [Claviceps humidiphila]